ncbi:MAG: hypothetical protein FWD24_09365 [Treponema sp.]|nr:hypothetical protein [Treponema sp.]
MKKLLLVFVLAAILVSGTVFAQGVHPNGFGIGILWGGSISLGSDNSFSNSAALSLKLPDIPIFWGISARVSDPLILGLQGDTYILGGPIVPTLGWFLGIGGYGSFALGSEAVISFGARLPIGITWQPIEVLEVFGNIAPSIGLAFWTHGSGGMEFPQGFIPIEIGIRFWL